MRKICVPTIVLIATFLIASSTMSALIWESRKGSSYSDKRACKVGDVITVLIDESATSTASASTNTKKDSSTSITPGVGPIAKNIPGISTQGSDSMKASGSTSRNMSFATTMTVTVTKVEENGNLQVEGTRKVQTNKEVEEVKLTGVVRPQDISTNNTILSTSIADAKITHVGSGPIASGQKMGILTRILRILF